MENNSSVYEGNAPYIFISYAHVDSSIVVPIIDQLTQWGFRVWYDAGIEAGTEWPQYIASHLENSQVVISFISKASIESPHCRQEITFAESKRKEMLAIYLDDVKMPAGLEMQLGNNQSMFYQRASSFDSFIRRLITVELLQSCCAQPRKLPFSRTPSITKHYTSPQIKKRKGKSCFAKVLSAILVIVAIVVGLLLLMPDSTHNGKDNFEWLDTGLCTKIPEIDSNEGHYGSNSDVKLDVRVENISYSQFEKYTTACKDMGYRIDAEKDTSSYTAYNTEGYYLDLHYWGYSGNDGPLDIKLLAPLVGDENFVWPTGSVADVIPKVEFVSGKLDIENGEEVEISLFDFTIENFNSYVQQCKNDGFNIDDKEDKTETFYKYEAYNSEGYKIRVSLDNMKKLIIHMRVPRKKDMVSWPTTGPATMLPKLDNSVGEVSIDFEWSFSVYIVDMTVDDFNAYVERCIDYGFEKSMRTEHYFSADKGDDISVIIEHIGFNTVYISIDDLSKL